MQVMLRLYRDPKMALNRNSSFYTCIYFINYGTSDEIHHPGERIYLLLRHVLCYGCHACMNWNVVDICKAVVLASVMVLT